MRMISLGFALSCGIWTGPAAELDPVTLQALKQELAELRQRTSQLEQKISALEAGQPRPATAVEVSARDSTVIPSTNAVTTTLIPAPPAVTPPAETTANVPPTPGPELKKPWSASDAIPVFRAGSAYMNLSLDALMDVGTSSIADVSSELLLGGHDPRQRGFSLPNVELAFDGAVDPYLKGFANIAFSLDNHNETQVELEETYLLTTSLPANFQLKAGQFLSDFGRQNQQHPHQWAFVDQPLALNRALGPDGLRNPGARISWLAPTPFYTELSLGIFNGQGETAFSFRNPEMTHGRTPVDRDLSSLGDLLYVPRLSSSFELTDTQTLVAGTSAALGPNDSGTDTRTQIYGLDLYWKWKSPRANQGFPFVSWQTEALYTRYEAGADPSVNLPRESLDDWGFYSEILWGFRPRWVGGLRGEYVNGNTGADDAQDVYRGERTRFSPNLTWYPSEFSKLRLEYDLDHGDRFGVAHSVWFQVEFLLGAHAAHKF